MSALARRLREVVDRAGYGDDGGIARLHRVLSEQHGATFTCSALRYWLAGDRRPTDASTVRLLLDVLDVRGDERTEIVRLALPDGFADLLSANRPPEAA